ncbi:uncharacterized protein LOC125787207 isoform X2 [Astyanax mexicanus]|uniref:uncharacterized protein LOC125787207 isoform X2 n=1 Tax=Astyanax mexicanus TaxID=7994 RepID=UPI0020CADAE8|nr:uncharacterized protein LOC125787207 isoform X2 [Astyanax mexicanus]
MNSGIKIEEKKAELYIRPNSTQISAAEDRYLNDTNTTHRSHSDEDYRPLPSPASCSVLRSSCSPPRSKELRVTFQQDSSTSYTKSRTFNRASENTTPSALWKTSQQPLFRPTQHKPEGEASYLASDTRTYGSDRALDSMDFTDAYWPTPEPGPTSVPRSIPQKSSELESHTNRLLQLSSDLYAVTHLPDIPIPVRSFSDGGPEKRSSYCTLSMESLLQPSKHKPQQTLLTQHAPFRQNDGAGKGLETRKQTILSKDKRGTCPIPALQPDGPDLCMVLRALLDLVDQHWSGPFSLHLNPSFMAQAIRLLMPLTSPVPPFQTGNIGNEKKLNDEQLGTEEKRKCWNLWNTKQEKTKSLDEQTGVEKRRSWEQFSSDYEVTEADYLKKQLTKTQNELESLKKRLISSLKENFILRSDKKKLTAGLKTEAELSHDADKVSGTGQHDANKVGGAGRTGRPTPPSCRLQSVPSQNNRKSRKNEP